MATMTNTLIDPSTNKRAALYLRVSTGRQAEGEVSLPSQRDLTTRYSETQGWASLPSSSNQVPQRLTTGALYSKRCWRRRRARPDALMSSAFTPSPASIATGPRWS